MSSIPICRERVTNVELRRETAVCQFGNQTKLFLSRFLGSRVAVGDEVAFPVPAGNGRGTEILITNSAASGPNRHLYQTPIGYVSQPKQDKRNRYFVSAEVNRGGLGIGAVFVPCDVLREYFYRLTQSGDRTDRPTLYEILRVPASASAAELRVAFKLRDLELTTREVPRSPR